MVKARSPGKDGQSMAYRKTLGIYAVVTVSSPSMMMMLSCHSYNIFSRKAVGMYAVTAVNKPSITKPTLCCPR